MVWLCNVARPEDDVIERLESFAAGGGGVVFFLGNQIVPSRYNSAFYKNGEGLLPMLLGEISGDPDRPDGVFLSDETHSTVADFSNTFALLFGFVGLLIAVPTAAAVGVLFGHAIERYRASAVVQGGESDGAG